MVVRTMKQRRGGDLSSGQQQQLAIGRALASRPQLLILDEPTEGIQPSVIKEIGEVIRQLASRGDMAILLVEQFYDFAAGLADHYLVMSRGATLQGVFQNPLVDPHIIGVTAGSAFGGTLAILLGVGSLLMMASTFFFGLVALGLIYALAALQGRDSTLGLILSGIILSGFFAALVSLMQYLADSEETLPNIVFWLLGSFATASWHKVLLMSPRHQR